MLKFSCVKSPDMGYLGSLLCSHQREISWSCDSHLRFKILFQILVMDRFISLHQDDQDACFLAGCQPGTFLSN